MRIIPHVTRHSVSLSRSFIFLGQHDGRYVALYCDLASHNWSLKLAAANQFHSWPLVLKHKQISQYSTLENYSNLILVLWIGFNPFACHTWCMFQCKIRHSCSYKMIWQSQSHLIGSLRTPKTLFKAQVLSTPPPQQNKWVPRQSITVDWFIIFLLQFPTTFLILLSIPMLALL